MDPLTGETAELIGSGVHHLITTPNTDVLAADTGSGLDYKIRFFNPETCVPEGELPYQVAGYRAWDPRVDERVFTTPAVSPEGEHLALWTGTHCQVFSDDAQVIGSVSSLTIPAVGGQGIEVPTQPKDPTISRDGKKVVWRSSSHESPWIYVVDTDDLSSIQTIDVSRSQAESHFRSLSQVLLDPTGRRIVTTHVARDGNSDPTTWLELWDSDTGEQVATLGAYATGETSNLLPRFSFDGSMIAVAAVRGSRGGGSVQDVEVWSSADGALTSSTDIRSLQASAAVDLSTAAVFLWGFSRSGEVLLTGSSGRSRGVLAFNPRSSDSVSRWVELDQDGAQAGYREAIGFGLCCGEWNPTPFRELCSELSADSSMLMWVHSLRQPLEPAMLFKDGAALTGVFGYPTIAGKPFVPQAFSLHPNQRLLAYSLPGGRVRVFDVHRQTTLMDLGESGDLVRRLKFTADGKRLVAVTNDSLAVYHTDLHQAALAGRALEARREVEGHVDSQVGDGR